MFLFPRNQCDCESLCAGNSLCTTYTWFDKEDPGEMVIIIISISITKNSCSSFVFLQLFDLGQMVITIPSSSSSSLSQYLTIFSSKYILRASFAFCSQLVRRQTTGIAIATLAMSTRPINKRNKQINMKIF